MARFAVALSLTLFVASGALAQTGGILPFSTQAGSGIDSIDLATSNIYIQIPVRSKPGAVPAQFSLVLNSNAYVSNGTWVVSGGLAGTPLKTGLKLTATVTPGQSCGQWNDDILYTAFVLIDTTGASHSLPGVTIDTRGCYPPPANPVLAGDHSGYSVQLGILGGTAYDPSGNSIPVYRNVTIPSTTLTDPDGNTLQYSFTPNTGAMSFTDTLGQTVVSGTIHSNSAPGSQSSQETYQYTDENGHTQTYTVTYSGWPQRTAFGCNGINDINTGTTNVYFPTTISLPGGSSYQIGYETTPNHSADVTGRIASITLPSGGSISYTYADTAGHHGMNCTSQVVPTLTRTVKDNNGNTSPWTYTSTRSGGSPDNYTVTVTDPSSNQVVYSFSGEFQTQVASYQGSATGTPLQISLTCYNANFTNCATPASTVSYPITQRDVYTNLNSSSPTTGNRIQTQYDTYGNLTSLKQYGWGPTLASQTFISYGQSWNGSACSAYTSANIYNTPCYIHTQNASGTDVAKTQITYSGIGHPTTTSRWVSGSTWLSSSAAYASNGTLTSVTDVNSAVTAYSNFACNGLLPQTVTLPQVLGESSQMSASVAWNCNGGVISSSTDANGKTTTYTHDDPFWRVTNAARPDGGSTATAYSTGSTLPWTITTTTATDASNNITVTNYLDGLVRSYAVNTSDPQSSTGYSQVQTTYNTLGQVVSVTSPYYANSDPTYGVTSYNYDALSRVTKITSPGGAYRTLAYNGPDAKAIDESNVTKVYESDGLGRLASVCEVTSVTQKGNSGTPSTCSQSIAPTGFFTSYAYDALGDLLTVAEPGVISRTYQYDGLSRLTSESNPESGTTTYTYDASGQQGDLATRTRPAANQSGTTCPGNCETTTYVYDVLHRLSTIQYGSTVSTIWRQFLYDQSADTWGQTLQNTKGRLSQAFTCCVNTQQKQSSDSFSYDSMGRVLASLQCPAANCGGVDPALLSYAYDFLGALTQAKESTDFSETNFNTYTFSTDANGRLTQETSSLTGSTYPSPLYTVNSYNALGEVVTDTLGNGIQRTFSYDHRGRLTGRTDGSVYTLGLTYQSNSAVQTVNDTVNGNWTYGYDGFNRLSTASETGQAFTYGYDPAGNRWSTISGVNQYTFNTNNHITSGGITYDAAGNVTYDGFHSYTYDAENRLLTVDGSAQLYFYDALSRPARTINSNGTSYYRVFGLNGRTEVEFLGLGWATSELYIGSVGDYLGNYSNGTTSFSHSDQVGTRRAYTGPSGSVLVTCTSLPFGNASNCSPSSGSPTLFTGQDWDPATNLLRFPMRNYATVQGRWLHQDPAGLAAVDPTNPQTWNRYAYVTNNPVSFFDPSGLGQATQDGCYIDHIETDCGMVYEFLSGGAGALFNCGNWCDSFASGQLSIDGANQIWGWVAPVFGMHYDNWGPGQMYLISPGGWQVIATLDPGTIDAANNGNPSWWGAFAGNLFSWKNFTNEFKQGGCVNVAVNATAGALNPFSPSLATAGQATAAVLAASQYNAAVQYAASAPNYLGGTGLIYPMKSSVVRGMIADANATAAEAPLFAVDGALLQGVIAEGISMANGECH